MITTEIERGASDAHELFVPHEVPTRARCDDTTQTDRFYQHRAGAASTPTRRGTRAAARQERAAKTASSLPLVRIFPAVACIGSAVIAIYRGCFEQQGRCPFLPLPYRYRVQEVLVT